MKRFLFSAVLLSFSLTAFAQIPNPGFEDVSALPTTTGQWNLANSWTNAGSSIANPDLFHSDGSVGGDLPETPIALVDPHGGSAIMGFIATGVKGTDRREYLSVELDTPLIPGEKYTVSFYYCNGYITEVSTAGLGTSDFGVCFTTAAPEQNNVDPLELTPQFKRQTPLFSREWDSYTFSFYPQEAYTHMTIGVFGDDTGKDIEVFDNTNPQMAYYFVDDFSIELIENDDPLASEDNDRSEAEASDEVLPEYEPAPFFIPNAFTPNGDGDNDIFAPVVSDLTNYQFCVFSRWGELIFKTTILGQGWDGHSTNGALVDVGMYVWELSYTRQSEDGQLEDKRHRGTVNLIR
jgi:gliding motility-associated-like protein